MYFILKGRTVIKTEDDISFATLNDGSYFGEIEIIRKTYRDNTVMTEIPTNLISLKKSIIYEDIIINHNEFFTSMIQNMIKRNKFYVVAKNKIEQIIARGRDIALDVKKLKELKNELINISSLNYNKQYFYIGLQDLIKINLNKLNKDKHQYNNLINKIALSIKKNNFSINEKNNNLFNFISQYNLKESKCNSNYNDKELNKVKNSSIIKGNLFDYKNYFY